MRWCSIRDKCDFVVSRNWFGLLSSDERISTRVKHMENRMSPARMAIVQTDTYKYYTRSESPCVCVVAVASPERSESGAMSVRCGETLCGRTRQLIWIVCVIYVSPKRKPCIYILNVQYVYAWFTYIEYVVWMLVMYVHHINYRTTDTAWWPNAAQSIAFHRKHIFAFTATVVSMGHASAVLRSRLYTLSITEMSG